MIELALGIVITLAFLAILDQKLNWHFFEKL